MKLTPRLAINFVIYAAALLAGVSLLAYNSGRAALRSATIAELSATAIEKQAALQKWVEDKQIAIIALSTDPTTIAEASRLITASPDSPEASAAHDGLIAEMQPRVLSGEFLAVLLIDPRTGEVTAATDPDEEGKFKEDRPYFLNGKTGPDVQNLYYSVTLQGPAMTAAAPLKGADGKLLGVLAGRINLEEMNSIVNRRSGLRATDDAFLVNTSNLFVTQPYLVTDPAVLQRGVHTEAVNRCLRRTSGTMEADDYRGVPAVITYRWLPERELCLIVKIDQGEAYAPVRAFGRTVAAISALALLAAAVLAVGLARSLTRPILTLQAGAARLGRGELGAKLLEDSRDEMGALAHEFNQMAAALSEKENQLRAYSFELEQRVEERTGELQQSEEQFRLVTEASPNAMIMVGREGKISFANQTAVSLFGYAYEEMIGSPIETLLPERFRAPHPGFRAGFFADAHPRAMGKGRDLIALCRDGTELPVEIGLSPVETREGLFALATLTDIRERKRAEKIVQQITEDLRRSNAELEQFAYVASHDLQEPLRMVSSYMQLLAKRYQGKLDGDADEFIGFAVDGAKRMQNLINDLLAYSRVGTRGNPLTPVPAEDLLKTALSNLQFMIEESEAQITHDPLPVVKGDLIQLGMVFQNLLGNAIKFRGSEPPRIHVVAHQEGNDWIFSVRDNGIGFDPKFAERIFVIFQRLNDRAAYPGTGIGLAVCKRIILRHGGRMWVESEPGQGSVFYFSLPV